MIADTLHRCRDNSEYRNRHVPQESADIADTCTGIIWVCFGSEFNKKGNVRINVTSRRVRLTFLEVEKQ
jgi:hypothetical protein